MADIIPPMLFIETQTFTKLILTLMSDDEYVELQKELIANPECGDIIVGGGGIRKVRHALKGRGKSGGVRVIYYWVRNDGKIFLLVIYPKSKKDNLTDKEVAILRELVKDIRNG